ncbi:MAG TPA: hypothetical protein PLZ45_12005 [Ferruginibacter sp.]|nr:hypothetical protein [Chitinophagaceae bacterium]HRI25393.1 hypothetical protein [Ferruginibacter sp.]
MLFNLFGKKDEADDKHVFTDRAYVSTAAKMNACAALAKKEPSHLFLCWFPETATRFREFFRGQGLAEDLVLETRHVHASKLQGKKPVFAEHYPLHAKETALIHNWGDEKIIVFSALDEPLFKHFGSDKVIPMIKLLGMKEDEAIEHSLVTKSIIKGQEKIAELVGTEQPANSQAEWMQKNIK